MRFFDNNGRLRAENGLIEVYVDDSSGPTDNKNRFRIVNGQDPREDVD